MRTVLRTGADHSVEHAFGRARRGTRHDRTPTTTKDAMRRLATSPQVVALAWSGRPVREGFDLGAPEPGWIAPQVGARRAAGRRRIPGALQREHAQVARVLGARVVAMTRQ